MPDKRQMKCDVDYPVSSMETKFWTYKRGTGLFTNLGHAHCDRRALTIVATYRRLRIKICNQNCAGAEHLSPRSYLAVILMNAVTESPYLLSL